MTSQNPNLDHHLAELHQVAGELRAARVQGDIRRRARGPTRSRAIRTALGRACLAAASALLADPSSPARRPR